MRNAVLTSFIGGLVLLVGANAFAERQLLRSTFDLEDPSGYCLDIPGFGPRMRKDAPITTHTCKYNRPGFSVDEEFEVTSTQQYRLPEYDLCLSAGERQTGADVFTIDCGKDDAHAWTLHKNGQLTPSDAPSLCLTLSATKEFVNTAAGNWVPNSSRAVTLQTCAANRMYYQSWKWSKPDAQDTPSANTLRAGMNPVVAAGIKALGKAVRAQETSALYAGTARKFGAADVFVSEEIAYGPGAAERLQVYTGVNRNNPRNAAPILLLAHGGGFRRGGLGGMAPAAMHFAGLGYVVVNMTYAVGPAARWPGGGQSVANAVGWIKENAVDLKGDPNSIFVFGQSAGANIVAEFVFRPSLHNADGPTIAGAILGSPPVGLDPTREDASNLPYFGDITESWEQKQVLGNLERTSIPVLILVAEFEPPQIAVAATKLFSDLFLEENVAVRFRQLRGHNHTSHINSIGTADTQASEEIIDFIATAAPN